MLFYEIALMFARQVSTPIDGELELTTSFDRCLEDLDTLGIGHTLEGLIQYEAQTIDELLVKVLSEERQVIHTVIKSPLHAVLDELLCQIHILLDLKESYFGLDHPELCEVTRRIGVLRTECWPEGVDTTECQRSHLTLELTRDSERRVTSEEVFLIVDLAVFGTWEVVQVECRDLEHLPSTFGITRRDQRRVHIEEATLVEECMDSDRHVVTHAIDRPKGIRTRTQVGDLTEEFQRVPLLLQGIGSRICRPEDFEFVCLYFYALPLTLRGDEFADHAEACPRGDLSEKISVEAREVDDDLDIMDRRAVIQCDEANSLIATAGTDPALDVHLLSNE